MGVPGGLKSHEIFLTLLRQLLHNHFFTFILLSGWALVASLCFSLQVPATPGPDQWCRVVNC